jgi:hypothetical protein
MNIGLKPIALALLLATTFPAGVANAKAPEATGAQPAPAPAVKVSNSAAPSTSQEPQRDVTDVAAVESWAHKDYQETGHEFKAAAHGLESAASWVGGEAKAGALTTVAGMRALRARLISGAVNARDEVDKGFAALDSGIGELNGNAGGTKQAPPEKAPS